MCLYLQGGAVFVEGCKLEVSAVTFSGNSAWLLGSGGSLITCLPPDFPNSLPNMLCGTGGVVLFCTSLFCLSVARTSPCCAHTFASRPRPCFCRPTRWLFSLPLPGRKIGGGAILSLVAPFNISGCSFEHNSITRSGNGGILLCVVLVLLPLSVSFALPHRNFSSS